eukprot:12917101-Prorocentrum_lima.AAC.1
MTAAEKEGMVAVVYDRARVLGQTDTAGRQLKTFLKHMAFATHRRSHFVFGREDCVGHNPIAAHSLGCQ